MSLSVSCRGLVHIYRLEGYDVVALAGVDLDIAAGESVALLGPSGSGKSTLLHIFAGLLTPSAGRLTVGGHDIVAASPAEVQAIRGRDIGVVLQGSGRNLLAYLSVEQNVRFAQQAATDATARRDLPAPREVLDTVGLSVRTRYRLRPAQLTPAERQRLALAVALANRPGLLLVDEPTAHLDSRARDEVAAALEAIGRTGTTVIVVTHDPEVGARFGRSVTIRDGRVGAEGRRGEDFSVVGRDGTVQLPPDIARRVTPGTLFKVEQHPDGTIVLAPAKPSRPGPEPVRSLPPAPVRAIGVARAPMPALPGPAALAEPTSAQPAMYTIPTQPSPANWPPPRQDTPEPAEAWATETSLIEPEPTEPEPTRSGLTEPGPTGADLVDLSLVAPDAESPGSDAATADPAAAWSADADPAEVDPDVAEYQLGLDPVSSDPVSSDPVGSDPTDSDRGGSARMESAHTGFGRAEPEPAPPDVAEPTLAAWYRPEPEWVEPMPAGAWRAPAVPSEPMDPDPVPAGSAGAPGHDAGLTGHDPTPADVATQVVGSSDGVHAVDTPRPAPSATNPSDQDLSGTGPEETGPLRAGPLDPAPADPAPADPATASTATASTATTSTATASTATADIAADTAAAGMDGSGLAGPGATGSTLDTQEREAAQ